MNSFNEQWQELCRAVRRKPDLNLSNKGALPEPQEVANAMIDAEPWMLDGLQAFAARTEALVDALNQGADDDPLTALLQKEAPVDSARFVQLKWGYHYLLTAREMSEFSGQRRQSAAPDVQELLATGFEALHLVWQKKGAKANLKHPLAPLIEAWLQRPELIRPNARKNGIMPSGLFPRQPATVPAQLAFALDNGDPTLGRVESPQAQLPLFTELPNEDDIPVTPLLLADAAGFRGLQPGRGARLDKRLLIFSLLSMPLDQRRPGGRYEWRPSLKQLRALLWPARAKIVKGRRLELSSYRPSKHAHSLYSALQAINLAEIVMPDGYHWRPTIVRGYPSFDNLDSKVIIQIELPSGSNHGPAVDKPNLVKAGTVSDPAFDLELGLAYLWDEAKRHNGGFRIHATRPQALRNSHGHIVDEAGGVKTERSGAPSTRWDHPQAVLTGLQERHPQAGRVRVLTRADRHRLAYGMVVDKHTSQIRNEQSATDRLLTAMEKDGRIVIERDAVEPDTGKQGWRILEAWTL
ncbi:MAG: hypothetical protein OXH73_13555 [Caldilineaceae bacterium]|nr:hypothetical protein [Caldilineaceae bacterium]